MVAKTVQHNLHAEDFIGRWGGDEFLVILHNIEAEHLRSVANKMRVLIATAQLMLDQSKIRATVSIGGTPILAGDTVETILDRMDQGLYSAKAAGRNQVKVIFP
jgi:diguanylate cyclase (GGDEF)-like protein